MQKSFLEITGKTESCVPDLRLTNDTAMNLFVIEVVEVRYAAANIFYKRNTIIVSDPLEITKYLQHPFIYQYMYVCVFLHLICDVCFVVVVCDHFNSASHAHSLKFIDVKTAISLFP